MKPPKQIVIVAGEASGDIHAAHFVRRLKEQSSDFVFSGIGGHHMQEAGVELISDLARYGVAGFSEVFRHFRVIRRAFYAIKAHLAEIKPDLLILVDYPGFNLRLAKFAKKTLGLRILYYISPQIWAWKANRIHTIRACVDHMAVIFPFEKEIYQQAGVPASFVGHPLVDTVNPKQDSKTIKKTFNLPEEKPIIAMLPGSRTHEIDSLLPVLCEAGNQLTLKGHPFHVVIPVASSISHHHIRSHLKNAQFPYTLISGQTIDVVSVSEGVVVASGTASLECALLKKPMCIIYKTSRLTYFMGAIFVKIPYIGLCNVLSKQMIVPELLQYDCNANAIAELLLKFLNKDEQTVRIVERLNTMKNYLSPNASDCSISDLILSLTAIYPVHLIDTKGV
jgi:lipid-A-disaccharide synthase